MTTLEKFGALHGTVHHHFNQERHLFSKNLYRERRSAALAEWRAVMRKGQAGVGEMRLTGDESPLE